MSAGLAVAINARIRFYFNLLFNTVETYDTIDLPETLDALRCVYRQYFAMLPPDMWENTLQLLIKDVIKAMDTACKREAALIASNLGANAHKEAVMSYEKTHAALLQLEGAIPTLLGKMSQALGIMRSEVQNAMALHQDEGTDEIDSASVLESLTKVVSMSDTLDQAIAEATTATSAAAQAVKADPAATAPAAPADGGSAASGAPASGSLAPDPAL